MALGALVNEGEIALKHVGHNPQRRAVADLKEWVAATLNGHAGTDNSTDQAIEHPHLSLLSAARLHEETARPPAAFHQVVQRPSIATAVRP